MGVAFALIAALAFGVSDFVAGLMSRRAAAFAVAVVAQAAATAMIAVIAPFSDWTTSLSAFAWGALSGVGSGAGTAFLYRGLGSARMSVVASLSSVCAAGLPVVVGVGLGERPSLLGICGIAIAIPAVWLVSRSGDARPRGVASGVIDGAVAGGGFALLYIALAQVPAEAGLWPLAVGQATSILVVWAFAVRGGVRLRLPPRLALGGVLVGVLGGGATLLYMLATRQQLLAVVAVLTSLYPASTILLARIVLRERITAGQGLGLLCAAAAVSLIAVG